MKQTNQKANKMNVCNKYSTLIVDDVTCDVTFMSKCKLNCMNGRSTPICIYEYACACMRACVCARAKRQKNK